MRKWALTMARNSVGTVKSGMSEDATTGGTANTAPSPGRSGTVRSPKSSALTRVPFEGEGAQALAEDDAAALRLDVTQRRFDEGCRQSVAREQRPIIAAAGDKRVADHRRGEFGGACRRFGVERGQQQRVEQPVVQRPLAVEHLADGRVRRGAQQAQNGKIIAGAGARHAAVRREDPPTDAAVIGAQRPALVGGEIDEWETCIRRTGQAIAPADPVEIAERGAVAGQQQMIAVVDGDAKRGIVI